MKKKGVKICVFFIFTSGYSISGSIFKFISSLLDQTPNSYLGNLTCLKILSMIIIINNNNNNTLQPSKHQGLPWWLNG